MGSGERDKMSRKRLGRLQRAATIVPLALLSMAWTAGVYGIGGVTSPVSAGAGEPITEGISVPAEDLEDPASVTNPGSVQGADGTTSTVASTNEIPSSSEPRLGGKEWVSKWRSGGSPYHQK